MRILSAKDEIRLLYALLAFVVIDYITGIMCAVVDKKLSSEIGFKGIFKKILIFALAGNSQSSLTAGAVG